MKTIETERLLLGKWSRSDAQRLYEYASNPAVGEAAGWKPHKSVAESKRIILRSFIPGNVRCIRLKETGEAIGTISFREDAGRPSILSAELGFSLDQKYWGNGYMTEAAAAMLTYGFSEMILDIVAIATTPDNDRSRRLIEKLGFVEEGVFRHSYRMYDDSVRDVIRYSMMKQEWLDRLSPQ